MSQYTAPNLTIKGEAAHSRELAAQGCLLRLWRPPLQLDRAEPGLAVLLHRRASAWHQAHGNVAEAIGHAISAGSLADAQGADRVWMACLLQRGPGRDRGVVAEPAAR